MYVQFEIQKNHAMSLKGTIIWLMLGGIVLLQYTYIYIY